MKRVMIGIGFIVLLIVVFILPMGHSHKESTKKEVSSETTISSSEESVQSNNEKSDSKSDPEEIRDSSTMSSEKEQKNDTATLETLGNAYANYSSINERNAKLKKIMTEDCRKKNGIDVTTNAQLSSEGTVSDIYQTSGEKYAILLDCKQSERKVQILLLVEVKENKISTMTYNTIQQAY